MKKHILLNLLFIQSVFSANPTITVYGPTSTGNGGIATNAVVPTGTFQVGELYAAQNSSGLSGGISGVISDGLGGLTANGLNLGTLIVTNALTNLTFVGGSVSKWTNSDLTASRVLVSDSNKVITNGTPTITEINFVSGVSSPIQTQITANGSSITTLTSGLVTTSNRVETVNGFNVKLAGDTMTGTLFVTGLTNNALTASRVTVTDANKASASSATTATEIGYVNGVTSAIQTQLNAKNSATVGSIINTGTPVIGNIARYTDTTGTNVSPTSIICDGNGNISNANSLIFTNTSTANGMLLTNGIVNVYKSGIGSTPTAGIVLTNVEIATSGSQKDSPFQYFYGSGWGTTGSAAQQVAYKMGITPVQGTVPSVNWTLDSAINGGAFSFPLTYTSAGSMTLGLSITIGDTGAFQAGVRSGIKSSADGLFELFNAARTGFTALNFGGTSSSFPQLRVSGTTLQHRLADNSADGPMSAGAATFSGDVAVSKTITTVGTTGNQTINKTAGRVNIAASGTTITVTDNLVTSNSIIMVSIATDDVTATIKNVVASAGSFVIKLTAATTAETAINFLVVN